MLKRAQEETPVDAASLCLLVPGSPGRQKNKRNTVPEDRNQHKLFLFSDH